MGSRFRPYLTFWVVAVVALAADLATKWLVVRHLPFNTYFPEAAGARARTSPTPSPTTIAPGSRAITCPATLLAWW